MVKSFLYFDILSTSEGTFLKPVVQQVKAEWPGMIVMDLDNHSGSEVVKAASQLVDESDAVVLFINAHDEIKSLPVLRKIVLRLQKKPNKLLITKGVNQTVDQLLRILKNTEVIHHPSNETLIKEVNGFLQRSS